MSHQSARIGFEARVGRKDVLGRVLVLACRVCVSARSLMLTMTEMLMMHRIVWQRDAVFVEGVTCPLRVVVIDLKLSWMEWRLVGSYHSRSTAELQVD